MITNVMPLELPNVLTREGRGANTLFKIIILQVASHAGIGEVSSALLQLQTFVRKTNIDRSEHVFPEIVSNV